MEKNSCREYRELMMGLMDGELSEEEASRVTTHMIRCASCRNEYEQLKDTSARLSELKFPEPDDRIIDRVWKSPYSRLARISGVIMMITGWLAIMIFGIYEALISKDTQTIPKFALAVIIIGGVILFVTILRDRIKIYKTDPYKEVDR